MDKSSPFTHPPDNYVPPPSLTEQERRVSILQSKARDWNRERQVNRREQDIAISEAAREYEEDGVVSTTTYMAMTQAGVDADSIIEFFEENKA